jgi:hypothetical protein
MNYPVFLFELHHGIGRGATSLRPFCGMRDLYSPNFLLASVGARRAVPLRVNHRISILGEPDFGYEPNVVAPSHGEPNVLFKFNLSIGRGTIYRAPTCETRVSILGELGFI